MWSLFRSTQQLARAVLAIAAIGVASSAMGAQYLFTPSIDQYFQWDDNLLVANEPPPGSTAMSQVVKTSMYRLSPTMGVSVTGDRLSLTGRARADFSIFDDETFNTEDQFVSFSARYGSETSLLQLDADVRRQSQRTAEIDSSGLLGGADRVELYSVRPAFIWQLNDLYRFTTGLSFNAQQFAAIGFNDYKTYGADIALSRQLSQRKSIDLTIFTSEYETESRSFDQCQFGFFQVGGGFTVGQECSFFDTLRESTTLGAQIGFHWQVSEDTQISLSIGAREVEARDIAQNILTECIFNVSLTELLEACTALAEQETAVDSSGLITSASYSKTGEKLSLNFSYSRSISPVGLGFLIESDQIDARADYRLSDRGRITGRINSQRSEAAASRDIFNREFLSFEVGLPWRVAQHWFVSPGIRYREQDANFLRETAESLTGYIQVSYRPQAIQVSR